MNGLALPAEPRTAIELFAGAAGLALGAKLVWPSLRTVCYVEREAYAAACLVARMEEARLDPAPIWDDVVTFDGRLWRGRVDLIAGGFPCTDVSNAGKRLGLAGERSGLWRHYARIVEEVRPRLVFIENVAALVSRDLEDVLADLAALGFDAEWGTLRASDVGAPHGRNRVFILAHASGDRREQRGAEPARQQGGPCLALASGAVAHAHVDRREGERGVGVLDGERSALRYDVDGRRGAELGHADGARLEGRSLCDGGRPDERAAGAPGAAGLWPPGPDDLDGWRDVLAGRPDLEPALRRMADGMANRVDRLRLTGNGVVPDQAALAGRLLFDRLLGGGR